MQHINILFILGALAAALGYVGFARATATAMMRGSASMRTFKDLVLFTVSPLSTFVHELGHLIFATLLLRDVTHFSTGFTLTPDDTGRNWFVKPGQCGFNVNSSISNGLICAGPFLLWVPLAGYLVVHPLFGSDLVNGLVVGQLLAAGFEVFWSVTDRVQIHEALKPLAYLFAGIFFSLMTLLSLVQVLQVSTQ